MRFLTLLIAVSSFCVTNVIAQEEDEDSTNTQQPPISTLSMSAYLEAYYGFDFNQPKNGVRPAFVYSHNRHNEVNINLAYLRAEYTTSRVRGALGLMTGTYANQNLASEPAVFRYVLEANAGVKLHRRRSIWLDAGIMPSHIGFESAISKDCPTLTRSILADNSPYYEAGARVGYTTPNARWYMAMFLLNGWQRIYRPMGNNTPAFGTQLTFRPRGVTINWSTFVGNDKPDSACRWRYFNNFYAILRAGRNITVTAGLDYGLEQRDRGSSKLNEWFGLALIAQRRFGQRWEINARVEHYADEHGVIIPVQTSGGFRTSGYSLGLGHFVLPNVLLRAETKMYQGAMPVFERSGSLIKDNAAVTAALSVSF